MTRFLTTVESAGLVEFVVRATLVLSVAMTLQWLTRKGSAAERHHLWTVTFALLLLLPALRVFGPSWDVPLLPGARGPEVTRLEALENGASVVSAERTSPVLADALEAQGARVAAAQPRRFFKLALLLWAIGSGAALVSVGVGLWRFHRLVRAGQPVEGEAWLGELDSLRKQLSVRADVRLVLGTDSATPMTGGLRRPVILLPSSAANWSESRRRVVLTHELVHVRRHDALRQLLGRAVLSFYWFHPLTWVASHFAAMRREEACDEEVLATGARPSDYARHLLSLAESSALVRRALSLRMAQQSQLERRIRAILKPRRARPRALVSTVALAVVTAAGISAAVANPIRSPSVQDALTHDAAFLGALLDCVTASGAGQQVGGFFAQGDDLFICASDEVGWTSASGGVRVMDPRVWAILESEIRSQITQLGTEGRSRGRKEELASPQLETRHGPGPR